ncbi:Laccase 1 [Operophtera brumata]|uniref:Laccase 1 n=1 Tax=Operophtera brumata TaxID=104452 RepID=A0A0L7LNV8_OPEBR|nr:Laccase 1 [Operophtera brumata]
MGHLLGIRPSTWMGHLSGITGYEQYHYRVLHNGWRLRNKIPPSNNQPKYTPTKTTQFKPTNPSFEDPGLDSIGMPRDGKNHPCYRECNAAAAMTCYYRFHVEWYYSMSKACKECPYNATHCGYPDCVPANGIGRPITVVNRKMPGPSIQVCKGDKIIVDVENSLMASATSIHWHGLHQKETPFMDGTPFVTQCPIQPESTFRYEFSTPQSGSFFWHSHIGLQRGDGTTGALIVREPKRNSPHRLLYDTDISEHVILVTDWLSNGSINLFTSHHHHAGDNRPESLLINGRGRFRVSDGTPAENFWLYTPQLNHISMKLPKSPLLVSRPSSAGFCNESTVNASCQRGYCECSHVLNVKLNSLVEVILIDEGNANTNHPFHLHGHSFRVVAQKKLGQNTTTAIVKAQDKDGKINRKLSHAPLKDTVTIPNGGYTIIRFIANNPGYWLFHCHIEFHAEIGMALVFKVGEHADMKPVPTGFPQCGDYKPTN